MSKNKAALVVVAKRPIAGKVKTRLYPYLLFKQAAELYACMLEDTLDNLLEVAGIDKFLALDELDDDCLPINIPQAYEEISQGSGNLGLRLINIHRTLLYKYSRVVFVGADSPTLPTSYIIEAFDRLKDTDVVIGPCDDGGYYAIGFSGLHEDLLTDIAWSTPSVLAQTLDSTFKANLNVHLLPKWYDIDETESLELLRKELKANPGLAPKAHQFLKSMGIS